MRRALFAHSVQHAVELRDGMSALHMMTDVMDSACLDVSSRQGASLAVACSFDLYPPHVGADFFDATHRQSMQAMGCSMGTPAKEKGLANGQALLLHQVVERRRIELPTFALRTRRSPS
jgi:hypothetical protein